MSSSQKLLGTITAIGLACLASGAVTPPAGAAPEPRADITLSITPTPTEPSTLEPLTYAIEIRNRGPVTATAAGFQASLPLDPVDIEASGGTTCAVIATGKVRCEAGDLQKGSSATVLISVQPTQAGTLTATFSGWSAVADPDQSNDEITVSTYVRWGTPPPVSCSGVSAPIPLGVAQWCIRGFTLTEPTVVTVTLQPGIAFTGSLSAELNGVAASKATATYVAGQFVEGQPGLQLSLPAGDWRLMVRAGKDLYRTPSFCIPTNPIHGCYAPFPWPSIQVPGVLISEPAAGPFGAEVTTS